MKILQVNSVFSFGSTGRLVQDIHRELQADGHESKVAFGRRDGLGQGLFRIGSERDVAAHFVRSRLMDAHGLGSEGATTDLLERISEWNPDVVHLHNLHGYYVNYEILFEGLTALSMPVVWTLHDCWAFTGHCAYFDFAGCERWRSGCGDCPQISAYPKSWFRDRSAQNFQAKRAAYGEYPQLTVVTPSRWLAKLLAGSLLEGHDVRTIPNDPDRSVFRPTESSWRVENGLDGRFIILGVANFWETRKGLEHLVSLGSMLRPDEVIVVVGRLPRGVTVPETIHHIPQTTDARELASIYSASDVFVNPTLEDNYPTTNLEAMACGTFVVTFGTGGAPETLERGRGVVTPERSSAGIRAALDEVRSGLGAPQKVAGALHEDDMTMAESYVRLYQEVTQR